MFTVLRDPIRSIHSHADQTSLCCTGPGADNVGDIGGSGVGGPEVNDNGDVTGPGAGGPGAGGLGDIADPVVWSS